MSLINLAKQSLSIVESSHIKDEELNMWLDAGIEDLERQGIDVRKNMSNSIIQGAVIMFVKANFGNVDIKEKELAKQRYSSLCNNLSLTQEYKRGESDA